TAVSHPRAHSTSDLRRDPLVDEGSFQFHNQFPHIPLDVGTLAWLEGDDARAEALFAECRRLGAPPDAPGPTDERAWVTRLDLPLALVLYRRRDWRGLATRLGEPLGDARLLPGTPTPEPALHRLPLSSLRGQALTFAAALALGRGGPAHAARLAG